MPSSSSSRGLPSMPDQHREPKPVLLVLGVFLLSLGATYATWRMAYDQHLAATKKEFDFEVRQAVRRIELRMSTYEQVARGTQAHLLGSMDGSAEDFRLFVAGLRLQEKFPGIQGIAHVRLVPAAELAAHEAAMRADHPGYAIRPAGPRPVYSAITRIEPYAGLNLRALGFDMLSEPTRRAAMERARDSGQAAASGKVRLIQEDGRNEQSGLVMYLPVYKRGASLADVEQRRAALIGWIGAPFRMGDLMAGLGGERSAELNIAIYDGNTMTPESQLYSSQQIAGEGAGRAPKFESAQLVWVAGRPWNIALHSTALFEQRLNSQQPGIVAAVGLILSLLLALLVGALATGRGRAIAMARNMTRQLSDSEFRWKYALEGAGDGVWDFNRVTGEMVLSRRWKEMLGYDVSEIRDDQNEWKRLCHPDDVPATEAILAAYNSSPEGLFEAEFRMLCKDGSWRWILSRGMAVTRDAAGRPLRTIGTHTDITRARKDAAALRVVNASLIAEQHRIRVLLDHSHDAFIAVAPDGRVSDWNSKAEQMFGWRAAEAIGADLASLIIPPDKRAAHDAGFRRFAHSGQGTLVRNVVEVNAMHRSGRLIPVEVAISGIPLGDGYAVSAFLRDISDRKEAQRLEASLQHARKLESVGKLTGGIAHDFNNVLHVLGGNVQLLQMLVGSDERVKQRLTSMQGAVERGAKLSSQLLSFARRQPLQPVVLDLRQTLRNMEDLLKRALGDHIVTTLVFHPALWNTLVDPGQLENVILNLAINARDAITGSGSLTVTLDNVTVGGPGTPGVGELAPGDYVRLSMADTGQGMSGEVAALAFEPFFTTKPVGQGTGLGLSMAYGFVKQSGGHIELQSAPGAGTTVSIYLQRSDAEESQAAVAPVRTAAGGHETILVVEDDPDVRQTAVSMLSGLGYTVLDAEDGASALGLVRSGQAIDLLFTDVVMPGPVSSTELAAQARQLLPRMAVLYTSGYTRDALTTGGRLDAGVQLLGKPYRREELAAKVRTVLDS